MKPWDELYKQWQKELNDLNATQTDVKKMGEKQKKLAKLECKISLVNEIKTAENKLTESTDNLKNETDEEMKELWTQEIEILKNELEESNNNLKQALIPNEKENVILEIRSGEGGDEASLFAMELYNMYAKLCKKRGWQIRIFNINNTESGGMKEGVFEISGNGVATWLNTESGVHCVKRVPKTEKKGRVHTSTTTVAVLPEPKEVEIVIHEKDLKIDFFRSSGPGGQSVNTTDSAVRITHIPTNTTVNQQDEKSQHKNREKGMKILKARIYQKQKDMLDAEHAVQRKDAVGSAKRNERIRTYHFLQNWVKDSRIDKTCHTVTNFMEGDVLSEFLDELIWESVN